MAMPTDIGIVDLGMGFPFTSIEEKKSAYDFFKANLKDNESLKEMEFPAQYMFKDVPDVVSPDTDVVAWIVEKMDAFNIEQCMTGVNEHSIRAKAEHLSGEPKDLKPLLKRAKLTRLARAVSG